MVKIRLYFIFLINAACKDRLNTSQVPQFLSSFSNNGYIITYIHQIAINPHSSIGKELLYPENIVEKKKEFLQYDKKQIIISS